MGNSLLKIIDSDNSGFYTWGDNCSGWHLIKSESLSVIKEIMPSMKSEKLHFHRKSQQFFYILSGMATFEIEGEIYMVGQNKGILIKPKLKHKILNNTDSDLEFLVVSEPESHGDRIDIEEKNEL